MFVKKSSGSLHYVNTALYQKLEENYFICENDNAYLCEDKINKEIEMVSKEVSKIRNEIKLCNKIKVKVPVMKEELEKLKIKENEKQMEEKQKNIKKKNRDYYR